MTFKVEYRDRQGFVQKQAFIPSEAIRLFDTLRAEGAQILAVIWPSGDRWSEDASRKYLAPLNDELS